MAQIDVTFNGDSDDLNDFCTAMGYKDQILDEDTGELIDNPETKLQFFKRRTKQYVWNTVYGHRKRQAKDQAADNVPYDEF